MLDRVTAHRLKTKSHDLQIRPAIRSLLSQSLTTHELYPNGISTSLPFDTQIELIHSIKGLNRHTSHDQDYAIEYDYLDPRDLYHSLASKHLNGLYCAGQINGTTGYEEAAAQGMLAGTNAALESKGLEPWIFGSIRSVPWGADRRPSDLGYKEPYRMFTSRAEHRLLLREDNADVRLTQSARTGLVGETRWRAFNEKQEAVQKELNRLESTWIQGSEQANWLAQHLKSPMSKEASLADLIRRPEMDRSILQEMPGAIQIDPLIAQQTETELKYAGYIQRQSAEIEKLKRNEQVSLPGDLDYKAIKGLSNEVCQKLTDVRPAP